jgi:hypothetical protein
MDSRLNEIFFGPCRPPRDSNAILLLGLNDVLRLVIPASLIFSISKKIEKRCPKYDGARRSPHAPALLSKYHGETRHQRDRTAMSSAQDSTRAGVRNDD